MLCGLNQANTSFVVDAVSTAVVSLVGENTMTHNERLVHLANASTKQLAMIDAVLTGDESAYTQRADRDIRTCTYTEAARRIGMSRKSVYRMVAKRQIKTVWLAGQPRILLSSLQNLVLGGVE